jgi:hypothetical protein
MQGVAKSFLCMNAGNSAKQKRKKSYAKHLVGQIILVGLNLQVLNVAEIAGCVSSRKLPKEHCKQPVRLQLQSPR